MVAIRLALQPNTSAAAAIGVAAATCYPACTCAREGTRASSQITARRHSMKYKTVVVPQRFRKNELTSGARPLLPRWLKIAWIVCGLAWIGVVIAWVAVLNSH